MAERARIAAVNNPTMLIRAVLIVGLFIGISPGFLQNQFLATVIKEKKIKAALNNQHNIGSELISA